MLEQKLNSEQKDEAQLPSSPNNGNTHVVRSPLLSDYLHLYLGCEIQYQEILCFGNIEIRKGLSFGVDDRFVSFYPITKYNKLSESGVTIRKPIKDCKLILRSLISMTKIEAEELNWSFPFLTSPAILLNNLVPKEFVYMLKKGFDLFGLISSGIAIEAVSER